MKCQQITSTVDVQEVCARVAQVPWGQQGQMQELALVSHIASRAGDKGGGGAAVTAWSTSH